VSDHGSGNGKPDEGSESMEGEEFVLEDEEGSDLEAAIQDALEAVEREPPARAAASESPKLAAVGGTEPPSSEELRQTQDRLMRALADFDNFRKRVDRERAEDRRYQGIEVLRDLLPIVDNLERALGSEGSVEDLKTGVRLTLKQMAELLERHGVRRIDSVGVAFDPRVHEAISHHPDPQVEEPTVASELEPGYSMRERLLRAARVAVAMPAAKTEEEPPPAG
jgi:molecular chaperone GrpE